MTARDNTVTLHPLSFAQLPWGGWPYREPGQATQRPLALDLGSVAAAAFCVLPWGQPPPRDRRQRSASRSRSFRSWLWRSSRGSRNACPARRTRRPRPRPHAQRLAMTAQAVSRASGAVTGSHGCLCRQQPHAASPGWRAFAPDATVDAPSETARADPGSAAHRPGSG